MVKSTTPRIGYKAGSDWILEEAHAILNARVVLWLGKRN